MKLCYFRGSPVSRRLSRGGGGGPPHCRGSQVSNRVRPAVMNNVSMSIKLLKCIDKRQDANYNLNLISESLRQKKL